MKKVAVKNYHEAQGQKMGQGGNEFTVKPIVGNSEASQYTASFVEVEPGNYAFGYHYHEMNEEIFYIISGTAAIRTNDGEITVKAGDAITFPTGPEGAHVVRNASDTERLVYLDLGTNNPAEIVHFPDIKKVMAIGPYSNGMYDKQE